MSLFSRLFKRNTTVEPKDLATVPVIVSGNNITVTTPEQAMRLDTVYRCVDILSGTVAALPLHLRRREGEIYNIFATSPINDLFGGTANPRQTFYVLMQNAIISLLLRGNAYIYPEYEDGTLVAMHLLDSQSVAYDVQRNVYVVTDVLHNTRSELQAWQIIHLKNKSLDGGYLGVSTITYASRTLSVSANADDQTIDGLKRGNKLKGFISGGDPVKGMGTVNDEVTDTVAKRLETEIAEDKSIMRLPGTLTFTPLSITPADAQLLETRKFSPYGICRFFGVHPDMVFVEQASNYKASENSAITFLNQTLRPLLTQIECEFKAKLVHGSAATRRNYKIQYDLLQLHASDLRSKAEYFKTSVEAGILTPNEIRIMENRAPIEGGDVTFISCNVAPIDSPKIKGEDSTEIDQNNPNDIDPEL